MNDFLQEQGKDAVRDGQFWGVNQSTGERLTVRAVAFVAKIILTGGYEGIEHAIAIGSAFSREKVLSG